ncbi:MAG: 50S ribosomal protein L33 [Candidatus Peregrinibacteria bacterium]|nr:50S ribosomal protein L33 [Candidatus Peregrinibacteria bacterium]
MARAKTVVAVWNCTETGLQTGAFTSKKDKLKDLTRMRYNPTLRKHTLQKAKIVKGAEK